jgi:hypothetical protein
MALVTTTLTLAVAAGDMQINVTSATGFAAGYLVKVDQEVMLIQKTYTSGLVIPVIRGQQGTTQDAHVITANVVCGVASDWSGPAPLMAAPFPIAGRPRLVQSITATSTLTLPPAGADLVVVLNGTGAITLTIPVPTADMDGTCLTILANGVVAHVPTFTGGLGGVGSGYTALTVAAGAKLCISVWACAGAWMIPSAPAWTGTVTKVTAGIA